MNQSSNDQIIQFEKGLAEFKIDTSARFTNHAMGVIYSACFSVNRTQNKQNYYQCYVCLYEDRYNITMVWIGENFDDVFELSGTHYLSTNVSAAVAHYVDSLETIKKLSGSWAFQTPVHLLDQSTSAS
jgi:hypothetical protein